ncbi:hypothetical protein TNIN_276561, partial [Trichonephila inaurata madagascariensis]
MHCLRMVLITVVLFVGLTSVYSQHISP